MSEKDITAGFAKKTRLVLLRFNRTYIETANADSNRGIPGSTGITSELILLFGHYSRHLFHHLISDLLFLGLHQASRAAS